ncbi:uncharacterized protein MONOS_13078 [Monocercomonoides exilis]|uniref:uncharacterized protein n=1 Tax=Monocercomonoides exilis TaxID=2049356 RepID=UPI003559AA82|nr:hypothetical protein MONOS_13078 [Monocercomonoides exilis]|eukprot:MONOS_13078.1-p1 / transcript=MONOS_13078.1 / gene=MONOS_13078 / organism=Monocercomonoides_exilis_PA203 / gene_product=unspecified product / transcript_product=unspecified product / location=Mono_scaffold00775:15819-18886(+) / protein_length=785 / sequence_SO=supercontig / SO=protein_coding / is_pseudo=false
MIPSLKNGTAAYQAGLFEEINKELNLFWLADVIMFLMLCGTRAPHIASKWIDVNPNETAWFFILNPFYQLVSFFYWTVVMVTILSYLLEPPQLSLIHFLQSNRDCVNVSFIDSAFDRSPNEREIHYSIINKIPDITDPRVGASGIVTFCDPVDFDILLSAASFCGNEQPSTISQITFSLKHRVSPVSIFHRSLLKGEYVVLSSTTPHSSIVYNLTVLSNSEKNRINVTYTEPFFVLEDSFIEARAERLGFIESETTSANISVIPYEWEVGVFPEPGSFCGFVGLKIWAEMEDVRVLCGREGIDEIDGELTYQHDPQDTIISSLNESTNLKCSIFYHDSIIQQSEPKKFSFSVLPIQHLSFGKENALPPDTLNNPNIAFTNDLFSIHLSITSDFSQDSNSTLLINQTQHWFAPDSSSVASPIRNRYLTNNSNPLVFATYTVFSDQNVKLKVHQQKESAELDLDKPELKNEVKNAYSQDYSSGTYNSSFSSASSSSSSSSSSFEALPSRGPSLFFKTFAGNEDASYIIESGMNVINKSPTYISSTGVSSFAELRNYKATLLPRTIPDGWERVNANVKGKSQAKANGIAKVSEEKLAKCNNNRNLSSEDNKEEVEDVEEAKEEDDNVIGEIDIGLGWDILVCFSALDETKANKNEQIPLESDEPENHSISMNSKSSIHSTKNGYSSCPTWPPVCVRVLVNAISSSTPPIANSSLQSAPSNQPSFSFLQTTLSTFPTTSYSSKSSFLFTPSFVLAIIVVKKAKRKMAELLYEEWKLKRDLQNQFSIKK